MSMHFTEEEVKKIGVILNENEGDLLNYLFEDDKIYDLIEHEIYKQNLLNKIFAIELKEIMLPQEIREMM